MANSGCVYNSPALANADEYMKTLSEDLQTYVNMLSIAKEGDQATAYASLKEQISTVDDLVSQLSEGAVKRASDLSKNPDLQKSIGLELYTALKGLFMASSDPEGLMYQASSSGRVVAAYDAYMRGLRGGNIAYRTVNGIMKLVGLGNVVELYANRHTQIKQYGPARSAYMHVREIENFANTKNKNLSHFAEEMLVTVKNDALFKENDVTLSVFNKVFPMFDETRVQESGHRGEMSIEDLEQRFSDLDMNIDSDQLPAIHERFKWYRDNLWYKINYGYTKEDLNARLDAMEKSHTGDEPFNRNAATFELASKTPERGSFLGHFADLRDKLNEIYAEFQPRLDHDDPRVQEVKDIIDKINDFTNRIRIGYIPGVGEREAFVTTVIGNLSEKLNFTSSFLYARNADDSGTEVTDFHNGAINYQEGMGLMFKEAAKILAHSYVRQTMDTDVAWFNANSDRRVVGTAIKFWLHDLEAIIESPKKQITTATKAIRRFSSVMGLIPATIMMFPGTAIKNVVAGQINFMEALGLKTNMKAFEDALIRASDVSPYSALARFIDTEADKWYVSTGIAKEFEMLSPDAQQRDILDRGVIAAMQLADRATKGTLAFLIPDEKLSSNMWGKLFSLKGSEDRLRQHYKGLIFNHIAEYAQRFNIKVDKSNVKALFDKFKERSWYEMQQALGDFSPDSKPYWAHTLGDTAENGVLAAAGAMLKWIYMFRAPMANNIDNFMQSASKIGDFIGGSRQDMTAEEIRNTKVAMLTTSGLALYALMDMMKETVLSESKIFDLEWNQLETFNPFQEYKRPMNLVFASTIAPLFNLRISEEAFKEIKASNIAFVLNMLGGREASDVIQNDGGMSEFLNKFTAIIDLPTAFTDFVINGEGHVNARGNMGVLYDKQREFRDAWGNTTNLDPVWMLQRVFEHFAISDTNPTDRNRDAAFKAQNIGRNLLQFLGLSVWVRNPQIVAKSVGSQRRAWDGYERGLSYIRKAKYYRGTTNATLAERQINSMQKYGKFFSNIIRTQDI